MLTKRIRKSSEILLGPSLSIRKPYDGRIWAVMSKAEELDRQSSWNSKSLWVKSLWAALSVPDCQDPCSIQLEKMPERWQLGHLLCWVGSVAQGGNPGLVLVRWQGGEVRRGRWPWQQAQGCKWSWDFCSLDPKSVGENRRNPTNFTNLWTRL